MYKAAVAVNAFIALTSRISAEKKKRAKMEIKYLNKNYETEVCV
jgi:hypothetical protein